MKTKRLKYVVSKGKDGDYYYCHMEGYAYIPVFGSIGDKKKASTVCRMMNKARGVSK